jgi:hypothetical protein
MRMEAQIGYSGDFICCTTRKKGDGRILPPSGNKPLFDPVFMLLQRMRMVTLTILFMNCGYAIRTEYGDWP